MEELGERRAGLLARAKVTEREREGLEGAKAAAEAYLGKEAECADARGTILQLFIRDGQVREVSSDKIADLRSVWDQHHQTTCSTKTPAGDMGKPRLICLFGTLV